MCIAYCVNGILLWCYVAKCIASVVGAPFGQVLGDKILEKPRTASDAEQMLHE